MNKHNFCVILQEFKRCPCAAKITGGKNDQWVESTSKWTVCHLSEIFISANLSKMRIQLWLRIITGQMKNWGKSNVCSSRNKHSGVCCKSGSKPVTYKKAGGRFHVPLGEVKKMHLQFALFGICCSLHVSFKKTLLFFFLLYNVLCLDEKWFLYDNQKCDIFYWVGGGVPTNMLLNQVSQNWNPLPN